MPELPEVESLRRGLEKTILGQKIRKVEVRKPKLVSGKGNIRKASEKKKREFIAGLCGARFIRIDRRAKNLLFHLSGGKMLLVHLKMSGQFIYREHGKNIVVGGHPIEIAEREVLPGKHTHVIFELERPVKAHGAHGTGGTLFYNDTRMFGYLVYYPDEASFEKENHFASLGPEPLDAGFTVAYLGKQLRAKKGKLKAVLLDQAVVVGLGNIYADEAAYEAGIRPDRSAASLTDAEIKKLHAATRRILKRAVALGGSSVATYRLVDEGRGNYAREHKVYGKSGTVCIRCGTPLGKMLIQSRTTVFCPRCQV